VGEQLLDLAIATTGGRSLWGSLRGLRIDISVTMQTLGGEVVATLSPARAAFTGMLRNSAWDPPHLGYFLGYACWNYFTTPFPGVLAREIEPRHEAGYKSFDGLLVAARRRVVRRNPNNTVNFNLPSITLDIHDVELIRSGDGQAQP
jgi:hypothetical protein